VAAAAPPAAAKAKAKRNADAEATTATGGFKKRAKIVREGNYPSRITVETLTATDNPDLDAIQAFRRENGDWAIYYVWKA
jgi:pyruvate/2-oxoglutarate dehydrogenase complex dihydrolipoamide acyltransferase (E2) component